MDFTAYETARQARDPRFDGRFFVGVRTTGIYCRPVCPAKTPRRENITFFASASAAAEAGFRPCLRCRPEAAPGTPAWAGTSTTVQRALRLIAEGALDGGSVQALYNRLGVGSRHLSRLFVQHVGAPPQAVAQTRRLHFAKQLLDETALPITTIATSAGYGSLRRFNDHFRAIYGAPPSRLRQQRPRAAEGGFSLRLAYRPPLDFPRLLAFFAVRAIPGVETVDASSYRRAIRVGGAAGTLRVTHLQATRQLLCTIDLPDAHQLLGVVERIRGMFDLNADPLEIDPHLAQDADLAPLVAARPGLRLPGAWDPFEIAVRAIVGQQVSVKGATTIMGRLAHTYGELAGEQRLFPTPQALAELHADSLPMPRRRAQAIAALARAVAGGELDFAAPDRAALRASLLALPGIGPWTADYIAMRALLDPDAFPSGDLVLRRVASEVLGLASETALRARAEQWRPWRAYAALHLWSLAS